MGSEVDEMEPQVSEELPPPRPPSEAEPEDKVEVKGPPNGYIDVFLHESGKPIITYILRQEFVSIGRDHFGNIRIYDPRVSRHHATITVHLPSEGERMKIILRNLNDKRGTYTGPTPMSANEEVEISEHDIYVQLCNFGLVWRKYDPDNLSGKYDETTPTSNLPLEHREQAPYLTAAGVMYGVPNPHATDNAEAKELKPYMHYAVYAQRRSEAKMKRESRGRQESPEVSESTAAVVEQKMNGKCAGESLDNQGLPGTSGTDEQVNGKSAGESLDSLELSGPIIVEQEETKGKDAGESRDNEELPGSPTSTFAGAEEINGKSAAELLDPVELSGPIIVEQETKGKSVGESAVNEDLPGPPTSTSAGTGEIIGKSWEEPKKRAAPKKRLESPEESVPEIPVRASRQKRTAPTPTPVAAAVALIENETTESVKPKKRGASKRRLESPEDSAPENPVRASRQKRTGPTPTPVAAALIVDKTSESVKPKKRGASKRRLESPEDSAPENPVRASRQKRTGPTPTPTPVAAALIEDKTSESVKPKKRGASKRRVESPEDTGPKGPVRASRQKRTGPTPTPVAAALIEDKTTQSVKPKKRLEAPAEIAPEIPVRASRQKRTGPTRTPVAAAVALIEDETTESVKPKKRGASKRRLESPEDSVPEIPVRASRQKRTAPTPTPVAAAAALFEETTDSTRKKKGNAPRKNIASPAVELPVKAVQAKKRTRSEQKELPPAPARKSGKVKESDGRKNSKKPRLQEKIQEKSPIPQGRTLRSGSRKH